MNFNKRFSRDIRKRSYEIVCSWFISHEWEAQSFLSIRTFTPTLLSLILNWHLSVLNKKVCPYLLVMWYSLLSKTSPSFLLDPIAAFLYHQRLCGQRASTFSLQCIQHTHTTKYSHALMLKYCILIFAFAILFGSEMISQGHQGVKGEVQPIFIPTAAYSECITIPLRRFYLTLWRCHVLEDGSLRMGLMMQHSQTSVEPISFTWKKRKNNK